MPIHKHGIIRLIVASWMLASMGCTLQRGYLVRGDWSVELNRTPWIGLGGGECPLIEGMAANHPAAPAAPAAPVEPKPATRRFFPIPTRPAFAAPARPTLAPVAEQPEEIEPIPALPESTQESANQSTHEPEQEPTHESRRRSMPPPAPRSARRLPRRSSRPATRKATPQPPVAPLPAPTVSIRQPDFSEEQTVAWHSRQRVSQSNCCGSAVAPHQHFYAAPTLDLAESWQATAAGKNTYLGHKVRRRSVQLRR